MRRIAVVSAALLAMLAVTGSPVSAEKTSGHKYVANMSGDQETPQKGDPDGRGKADIVNDTDRGELCYVLTYENVTPPDKAHIHRGAMGASGDVVINLDPQKSGKCVTADKALLQEIRSNPAGFYVNLHSPDYPKGSVRGQLEPVR
jgi:CHRD domain-containing protein